MARCEITDLDATMCAHCLGHKSHDEKKPVNRSAILARPGWFESQYRGVCDWCDEPFPPGTAICRTETRGWRAECCADEDA